MVPALLVAAAVVPVFPPAAQIDFTPLGRAVGPGYKLTITIESMQGQKQVIPIRMAPTANAEDACMTMASVSEQTRQFGMSCVGTTTTVYRFQGSPVKRVTFESTGAVPTFRWAPGR